MKSATTLFALFLLSALTLHLPSATADFVKDVDGDLLRNGGSYYIVSAIWGAGGGGVELAATGNETCPLTVVQAQNDMDRGLPVEISTPAKIKYIGEHHSLDLSFSKVPPCAPTPSSWTIVKDQPEGWAVKLPGYENTVQGSFRIESLSSAGPIYKLVFYPRDDNRGKDVGIVGSNGIRLLVVGTENGPFPVVFEKASFSAAAKIVRYSTAA